MKTAKGIWKGPGWREKMKTDHGQVSQSRTWEHHVGCKQLRGGRPVSSIRVMVEEKVRRTRSLFGL